MVIVGRTEEGLQRRRQRSSLDCQSCQYSQDSKAAQDRVVGWNTSSEAEAAVAALIRRDLPGNFTEEPLRPLWPLSETAATAYYILLLSADTAAITASACHREEGLQHNQKQQLPPVKRVQLGNRKPLQAHQVLLRQQRGQKRQPPQANSQQPPQANSQANRRTDRLRQLQQSAANSNKKKTKVAVNNSLTFNFFNFLLAFGLCKAPKIWRKRLRKKVGPGVVLAAVPARMQQAAPAYYSPLQM